MKLVTFIIVALIAFGFCAESVAGYNRTLQKGSKGPAVTQLQQFLHMNRRADFYAGAFDGDFGQMTQSGLKQWQKYAGFQASGRLIIGGSQWSQLRREAVVDRLPSGIDPRAIDGAKQDGWSVDASKHTAMLYLLHYEASIHMVAVALSTPTSFGGCNSDGCFVTPDGAFAACRKAGPNEVSSEWKDSAGNPAPMPWAVYMYIGGRCSGAAVHYDPLGSSHECVHVPSMAQAEYINQKIPLGGLIVIHD